MPEIIKNINMAILDDKIKDTIKPIMAIVKIFNDLLNHNLCLLFIISLYILAKDIQLMYNLFYYKIP